MPDNFSSQKGHSCVYETSVTQAGHDVGKSGLHTSNKIQ